MAATAGAVAADKADAQVRVYRHGDLTAVCVYDDVSGALGYCDIYG